MSAVAGCNLEYYYCVVLTFLVFEEAGRVRLPEAEDIIIINQEFPLNCLCCDLKLLVSFHIILSLTV